MKQKTKWFVKPLDKFTNENIMNWLERISEHQDFTAAKKITVKGQSTLAVEAPSYELVKTLIASAKSSADYKFEILFKPPNSDCIRQWRLYKHFKKSRLKKRVATTP